MTTNRYRNLDLVPEDSWDEIGPLTAYAVYRVFDSYEDLLKGAPSTLSRCLTYRSMITDRWVLKYIDYYPEDDYYPPAAGHHYHPKVGDLPDCPVKL